MSLIVATGLAQYGCDRDARVDPATSGRPEALCPEGDAVEIDGVRRLALIVGVGDYASASVSDLYGTVNDAWAMRDLLVGEGGYGFPQQNVCLLTDAAATVERFEIAFERALIARARPGDVVVVYFAGHGSQAPDDNGDEPDEWDETLLFHDSRQAGTADYLDDELHALLERLDDGAHTVVVLDSCNSATAVRRVKDRLDARYQPPASQHRDRSLRAGARDRRGDQSDGVAREWRSGTITLAAASDGTPALEKKGKGIFTTALVRVLGAVGGQPLTYAQAAPRVRKLVAAESYQTPYFHGGNLATPVFGNESRAVPRSWRVTGAGEQIRLEGPPLPGVGADAELRIYDGNLFGEALLDPRRSKATVIIAERRGVEATARVLERRAGAADVALGDLAVLVRPSSTFTKVAVSMRSEASPGGVGRDRAEAIARAIAAHSDARHLVDVADADFDFELTAAADGRLQLRGPENRIRTTFAREGEARAVAENLWSHAVQRALLQLSAEGAGSADAGGAGGDGRFVLVENETLRVRAVPAAGQHQTACATAGWEEQAPNARQKIPLCFKWHVEVELSAAAPFPLLVGGALLSTDGAILPLPFDGRQLKLRPGDKARFANGVDERFVAKPPVDVDDTVIIFGTPEGNQIPWNLLASGVRRATRTAAAATSGPLFKMLHRYLSPDLRGEPLDGDAEAAETAWTMTTIPVRVVANAEFLAPRDRSSRPADKREYTIPNFDIRPYLPEDPASSLHRVLSVADGLARYSEELGDGVPYRQHAWSAGSDRENLAVGIDCSRAIWYAFTRAGLGYATGPRADGYLATAEMVGGSSRMTDAFASCDDDAQLRLGDVIVYRDEQRNAGHTVMVIDVDKRIAWGSHGWDGNEDDTGVEYQMIKPWREWKRWDKDAMRRVACWRHRGLAERPGGLSLEHACDERRSCERFVPAMPAGGGD